MQTKFSSMRKSENEWLVLYEHQPSYFGAESLNSDVSSDELKIQKGLIKKGYQRVHEKIKELTKKLPKYLSW